MTKKTLAPRQARSRESERKLLKAATEVLGQHGVDGATIPRIAEHAGLTPGAVYRRFPDKNALLETVVQTILENQDARLRVMLTPVMTQQIPLPVLTEQLITTMLVSYRANAGLLRGLREFANGHDNAAFKARVVKIERRTFQYIVELFLQHRKAIRHPDPHLAVSFAFMTLISTLSELTLTVHDVRKWQAFLPKDDKALVRELKRMFLRYLDLAGED
ncbi:MAG TPA: TetR/AcrR family transcriptional regulator [Rudaea sp.]|nr:TetR/AcrR family transcriptional regulator [Rudaea sp.]